MAFTSKLAELYESRLITVSLHPGFIVTDIFNTAMGSWTKSFLSCMTKPFRKTVEQGAATSIFAAVSDELSNNKEKYNGN
eukprot:CAMPEP_0116939766 /NCGR_PEP_ID=MMETSP0467-20121206/32949_1 /TAXON_ID=283647 /ORGANISM="Mesodinium pulex, Strain SPMC105" /LENGTH=79 /DNA_ID=CAMNT_0004622143 /DNA_START=620 /DNA_END=859 /DNA_ORIENTATION=+